MKLSKRISRNCRITLFHTRLFSRKSISKIRHESAQFAKSIFLTIRPRSKKKLLYNFYLFFYNNSFCLLLHYFCCVIFFSILLDIHVCTRRVSSIPYKKISHFWGIIPFPKGDPHTYIRSEKNGK